MAHTEVGDRVHDGVLHRGSGTNCARLTDPLDSQRVVRAGRSHLDELEVRQLGCARERIVGEVRGLRVSVGVVQHFLEQCLRNTLGDAAVSLPFDASAAETARLRSPAASGPADVRDEENQGRLVLRSGPITEWYLNGEGGLEQGFTIDEIGRSGRSISFSGSARQIKTAFRTSIHAFNVNGKMHYGNLANPLVPPALANVILGFRSLNNFALRPRTKLRSVAAPSPQFTSPTSGNHYIAPNDFATIYNVLPLWNAGVTGNGQSIAIAGTSEINLNDVTTFRSAFGLPAGLTGTLGAEGAARLAGGEAPAELFWSKLLSTQITSV